MTIHSSSSSSSLSIVAKRQRLSQSKAQFLEVHLRMLHFLEYNNNYNNNKNNNKNVSFDTTSSKGTDDTSTTTTTYKKGSDEETNDTMMFDCMLSFIQRRDELISLKLESLRCTGIYYELRSSPPLLDVNNNNNSNNNIELMTSPIRNRTKHGMMGNGSGYVVSSTIHNNSSSNESLYHKNPIHSTQKTTVTTTMEMNVLTNLLGQRQHQVQLKLNQKDGGTTTEFMKLYSYTNERIRTLQKEIVSLERTIFVSNTFYTSMIQQLLTNDDQQSHQNTYQKKRKKISTIQQIPVPTTTPTASTTTTTTASWKKQKLTSNHNNTNNSSDTIDKIKDSTDDTTIITTTTMKEEEQCRSKLTELKSKMNLWQKLLHDLRNIIE